MLPEPLAVEEHVLDIAACKMFQRLSLSRSVLLLVVRPGACHLTHLIRRTRSAFVWGCLTQEPASELHRHRRDCASRHYLPGLMVRAAIR